MYAGHGDAGSVQQETRSAARAPWALLAWTAMAALSACGGGADPATADSPPPAAGTPAPAPATADVATARFTASSAEIANPERGMYTWAADNLPQWTQAAADAQYEAGYRIVYAPVRLDAYAGSALPQSLLDALGERFVIARRAGLKLVPRFLYNYPQDETQYRNAQDAPLDRVLAHIEQLKPVLAANADVIAFLQAGFIGAWGEWHTSSNDLTATDNRTRIRDALLDALPAERFLQLRYPAHLMQWSPVVPLWRDGSATARIGVHNDCFLASATDVGTYSEDTAGRARERDYVAALAGVAPFGGETCNPADEVNPTPRVSCEDILREGRQFALSYLNEDYYRPLFHERWQAQGCMAEVRRSLGYRFELETLQHSAELRAGASGELQFGVRNAGWARAYNPRRAELLLRTAGGETVVRIALPAIDPRDWLPGRAIIATSGFIVPADMAPGRYEVLLALPDGAQRLAGDARYSVRPANADDAALAQGWDAALGAFRTGTTLILSP